MNVIHKITYDDHYDQYWVDEYIPEIHEWSPIGLCTDSLSTSHFDSLWAAKRAIKKRIRQIKRAVKKKQYKQEFEMIIENEIEGEL